MAQITVTFYRPKSFSDRTLERVTIKTGKTTCVEAYKIACENGHDPNRNISFTIEEA